MKRLSFNVKTYEAEKIVKTNDSIVGYNGQNEVFAFRGVSDFSLFELAEGQEFDEAEQDETEALKAKIEELETTLDSVLTELIPSLLG